MSYEQQREYIAGQLKDFSPTHFEKTALDIFQFQVRHNCIYQKYVSLLGIPPSSVQSLADIPFLPIQFFKNHSIRTGQWPSQSIFSSSGTTGENTSRHYVRDLDFYKKNTEKGFEHFYGSIAAHRILALLPSYLERSGSSLVFMADHFINRSDHPDSGFFLYNMEDLVEVLKKTKNDQTPTLLIGVSFALLDLAERFPTDLGQTIIMETGGMKGRRKEMTRQELHGIFKKAFNAKSIHSEYGMTELFSQAYSKGDGLFYPTPTMCVFAREITDPLTSQKNNKTGVLNIIDLANFDTISFIATDDLGRVHKDGSFEVLGRLDNSDIRGCNLMVR